MAFTLWTLLKSGVLATNAVAVLNRKRFLKQYGLEEKDDTQGDASIKNQIVGLLQAAQYLKVPLIVLNGVVIVGELLFGA